MIVLGDPDEGEGEKKKGEESRKRKEDNTGSKGGMRNCRRRIKMIISRVEKRKTERSPVVRARWVFHKW